MECGKELEPFGPSKDDFCLDDFGGSVSASFISVSDSRSMLSSLMKASSSLVAIKYTQRV